MRKPDVCIGCPLYDDGEGFVPDELSPNDPQAPVDVWLQNPGAEEEKAAAPAVGATGDLLNDTFLPEAGLTRGHDVRVRNVLRCRWRIPGQPRKTNKLPTGKTLARALAHCRVHDTPTGARISVACGAHAWKGLGGGGSVTEWRGFLRPGSGTPTLATLHPADIFRNPKMKFPMLQDWRKVKAFLAGEWPKPVPPFQVVENSNQAYLVDVWCAEAKAKAPYVVMDTEFNRDTKYLLTLGLGYPGMERGLQIWFQHLNPVVRSLIKAALATLCQSTTIVFQNGMADIPVLQQNLGLKYAGYKKIEDTMLGHAVLWSEWPHTLEYLASIYGRHRKMKHLAGSDPKLYNWGDVVDTISVWQGIDRELTLDAPSKAIYTNQSLALVPIILQRHRLGIRTDQAGVSREIAIQEAAKGNADHLARAALGRPFNLGSDQQLKKYCYETKGYPIQLDKDKKVSIGQDAVAELRKYVGPPPDLEDEDENGLTIATALSRIQEGADPVLEARVLYGRAAQTLSHFLEPLRGQERIYPSIKIHAQASGRWSITDPPLQQFGHLDYLLIPDEGEVWLGWDWDQIELRLLAALAGDEPYLRAFANGDDVHTLNAEDLFGLPRGTITSKDDIRRIFAKRFVYRLNYGGNPRLAGDIPGARALGLDGPKLVAASKRYLAAHPAMAAWRVRVAAEAISTHVSRTFMGRRRRLLGEGQSSVREAYNHPMQGGVADILNTCIVQIQRELPTSTMVYTCHDAGWIAVREDERGNAKQVIHKILTQEWTVEGHRIAFPAKWKDLRVPPAPDR